MPNERAPFLRSLWAGVRAEIPLLLGVFPFGLIYGALALGSGLSPAEAQMMSSVVFAGSSQFVAAQMIRDAAPGILIVLSIAVVNLRHLLYSASIAPYLERLPARWKALLAYLLTDEAYAVSIAQFEREGAAPAGHFFLLGAGLALWTTWQVSSALGIFLGAALPSSWPIDFAVPVTFIATVVPGLKDKPALAAALSAAATALLADGLPYKLGLILAALVGIGVGAVLERRR
jgi:4-azaleucine resistance transporter AzlC